MKIRWDCNLVFEYLLWALIYFSVRSHIAFAEGSILIIVLMCWADNGADNLRENFTFCFTFYINMMYVLVQRVEEEIIGW